MADKNCEEVRDQTVILLPDQTITTTSIDPEKYPGITQLFVDLKECLLFQDRRYLIQGAKILIRISGKWNQFTILNICEGVTGDDVFLIEAWYASEDNKLGPLPDGVSRFMMAQLLQRQAWEVIPGIISVEKFSIIADRYENAYLTNDIPSPRMKALAKGDFRIKKYKTVLPSQMKTSPIYLEMIDLTKGEYTQDNTLIGEIDDEDSDEEEELDDTSDEEFFDTEDTSTQGLEVTANIDTENTEVGEHAAKPELRRSTRTRRMPQRYQDYIMEVTEPNHYSEDEIDDEDEDLETIVKEETDSEDEDEDLEPVISTPIHRRNNHDQDDDSDDKGDTGQSDEDHRRDSVNQAKGDCADSHDSNGYKEGGHEKDTSDNPHEDDQPQQVDRVDIHITEHDNDEDDIYQTIGSVISQTAMKDSINNKDHNWDNMHKIINTSSTRHELTTVPSTPSTPLTPTHSSLGQICKVEKLGGLNFDEQSLHSEYSCMFMGNNLYPGLLLEGSRIENMTEVDMRMYLGWGGNEIYEFVKNHKENTLFESLTHLVKTYRECYTATRNVNSSVQDPSVPNYMTALRILELDHRIQQLEVAYNKQIEDMIAQHSAYMNKDNIEFAKMLWVYLRPESTHQEFQQILYDMREKAVDHIKMDPRGCENLLKQVETQYPRFHPEPMASFIAILDITYKREQRQERVEDEDDIFEDKIVTEIDDKGTSQLPPMHHVTSATNEEIKYQAMASIDGGNGSKAILGINEETILSNNIDEITNLERIDLMNFEEGLMIKDKNTILMMQTQASRTNAVSTGGIMSNPFLTNTHVGSLIAPSNNQSMMFNQTTPFLGHPINNHNPAHTQIFPSSSNVPPPPINHGSLTNFSNQVPFNPHQYGMNSLISTSAANPYLPSPNVPMPSSQTYIPGLQTYPTHNSYIPTMSSTHMHAAHMQNPHTMHTYGQATGGLPIIATQSCAPGITSVSSGHANIPSTSTSQYNTQGTTSSDINPDMSRMTSAILKKIFTKTLKDIQHLSGRVRITSNHVKNLEAPDENSHATYKTLLKDVDKLSNSHLNTFEKYADDLGSLTSSENVAVYENIEETLDELKKQVTDIESYCSLANHRPIMTASNLGTINQPTIYVTTWRDGPGFFKSRELLHEHMARHPCSSSYYLSKTMQQLKSAEPIVYEHVVFGSQPNSLEDLFCRIALKFAKPLEVENMLIATLIDMQRLQDPLTSKNVAEVLTKETKKVITFSAVLAECVAMRNYYLHLFNNDPSRFHNYMNQGIFTQKFASQLLICVPTSQYMAISDIVSQLDFVNQINYYISYGGQRLTQLYNLRNTHSTILSMNETPQVTKPNNDRNFETSVKKVEQEAMKRLRKSFPSMQVALRDEEIKMNDNSDKYNSKSKTKPTFIAIKDPIFLNKELTRSFNSLLAGKPMGKLPIILGKDGIQHPSMNFHKSQELLTHHDFKTDMEKQLVIFNTGNASGCMICCYIANQLGKSIILLPHLVLSTEQGKEHYPSRSSRYCPQILRLTITARMEVVDKVGGLCKRCMKRTRSDGDCWDYKCRQPVPSKYRCKNKLFYTLCSCPSCLLTTKKQEDKYNETLQFNGIKIRLRDANKKLISPTPILLNCTQTTRDERHMGQAEVIDNVYCNNALEEPQGISMTAAYDNNEGLKEIGELDIERFRNHLSMFTIHKEQEFSLLLNKPKIESFNSMLKKTTTKKSTRSSCYFYINIRTPSGEVNAIWDSGSMTSVAIKELLDGNDYFYNKVAYQTNVEVVGGKTTPSVVHHCLLPLNDATHSHLLTSVVAVDTIVNDLPIVDMGPQLSRAYQDYLVHCRKAAIIPVERRLWPKARTGGKISFLVGCSDLSFSIIFSWEGLLFIRHSLASDSPIAFGGSYERYDNKSLITTITDKGEVAEGLQDTLTQSARRIPTCMVTSNNYDQHHAELYNVDTRKHNHGRIAGTRGRTSDNERSTSGTHTYSEALRRGRGDIERVKTCESVFSNKGLDTPKILRGKFLPKISGFSGNCIIICLLQKLRGPGNFNAQDILLTRQALRGLILDRTVERTYEGIFYPHKVISSLRGEKIIHNIQELNDFVKSDSFYSYWISEFELRCLASLFNVIIAMHIVGGTSYGVQPYYPFKNRNGMVCQEVIDILNVIGSDHYQLVVQNHDMADKIAKDDNIDIDIQEWITKHRNLGQTKTNIPIAINNGNINKNRKVYINNKAKVRYYNRDDSTHLDIITNTNFKEQENNMIDRALAFIDKVQTDSNDHKLKGHKKDALDSMLTAQEHTMEKYDNITELTPNNLQEPQDGDQGNSTDLPDPQDDEHDENHGDANNGIRGDDHIRNYGNISGNHDNCLDTEGQEMAKNHNSEDNIDDENLGFASINIHQNEYRVEKDRPHKDDSYEDLPPTTGKGFARVDETGDNHRDKDGRRAGRTYSGERYQPENQRVQETNVSNKLKEDEDTEPTLYRQFLRSDISGLEIDHIKKLSDTIIVAQVGKPWPLTEPVNICTGDRQDKNHIKIIQNKVINNCQKKSYNSLPRESYLGMSLSDQFPIGCNKSKEDKKLKNSTSSRAGKCISMMTHSRTPTKVRGQNAWGEQVSTFKIRVYIPDSTADILHNISTLFHSKPNINQFNSKFSITMAQFKIKTKDIQELFHKFHKLFTSKFDKSFKDSLQFEHRLQVKNTALKLELNSPCFITLLQLLSRYDKLIEYKSLLESVNVTFKDPQIDSRKLQKLQTLISKTPRDRISQIHMADVGKKNRLIFTPGMRSIGVYAGRGNNVSESSNETDNKLPHKYIAISKNKPYVLMKGVFKEILTYDNKPTAKDILMINDRQGVIDNNDMESVFNDYAAADKLKKFKGFGTRCFCNKQFSESRRLNEHILINHDCVNLLQRPMNNEGSIKCPNIDCDQPEITYTQSMMSDLLTHMYLQCRGANSNAIWDELSIYTIQEQDLARIHLIHDKTECDIEDQDIAKVSESIYICDSDIASVSSDGSFHTATEEFDTDGQQHREAPPILTTNLISEQDSSIIDQFDYDEDVKICIGNKDGQGRRSCITPHDSKIFCPLQDQLDMQVCKQLLHGINTHHLGNNCLVSQLMVRNKHAGARLDCQRVLINRLSKSKMQTSRDTNKLQKEGLNKEQKNCVEDILEEFLSPKVQGSFRCPTCSKCIACAPVSGLSKNQRLAVAKLRENQPMWNSVNIIHDPERPGFLRLVCRLPTEPDLMASRTNLTETLKSLDNKMAQLTQDDKISLQEEVEKNLQLGTMVKITDLPNHIQEYIRRQNKHYVCISPAFKSSSRSTKSRICYDLSRPDPKSRRSENQRSMTGFLPIDLAVTARQFKAYSDVCVCDITKFFNNLFLGVSDMARQLFVWKKNGMKDAEPEHYVITRLLFGHASSSNLARISLMKILHFGESICSVPSNQGGCQGKFSTVLETTDTPWCPGIAHIFAKQTLRGYVDDLCYGAASQQDLRSMMKYGQNLLEIFSYKLKGVDFSGQKDVTDTATVDENGHVLIAGYRWHVHTDTLSMRPTCITNGIKYRGKYIEYPKGKDCPTPPPLQEKYFTKLEEYTPANILKILDKRPLTLRLVVSQAATPFDIIGYAAPVLAQLRNTVSGIMKICKGEWDMTVPDDHYNFFLTHLIELYKVALYTFQRHPKNCTTTKGKLRLLVLSDAAMSIIIQAFLLIPNIHGNYSLNLVAARSYLGDKNQTVAKLELQGISYAADLAHTLVSQYGSLLEDFHVGTDAKISIFWILQDKTDKAEKLQNIYTSNRCDNIRKKLNDACRFLAERHTTERMNTRISRLTLSDRNYENHLFWVPGPLNTSDRGTRYEIFGSKSNNRRLLASDCSPDSVTHSGLDWMKQFNETVSQGTIRSARDIRLKETKFALPQEMMHDYKEGFKKGQIAKLQEEETIIMNAGDFQAKSIFPSLLSTTFMQNPLSCHECNDSFFSNSFLNHKICKICTRARDNKTLSQIKDFVHSSKRLGEERKNEEELNNIPYDAQFLLLCHTMSRLPAQNDNTELEESGQPSTTIQSPKQVYQNDAMEHFDKKMSFFEKQISTHNHTSTHEFKVGESLEKFQLSHFITAEEWLKWDNRPRTMRICLIVIQACRRFLKKLSGQNDRCPVLMKIFDRPADLITPAIMDVGMEITGITQISKLIENTQNKAPLPTMRNESNIDGNIPNWKETLANIGKLVKLERKSLTLLNKTQLSKTPDFLTRHVAFKRAARLISRVYNLMRRMLNEKDKQRLRSDIQTTIDSLNTLVQSFFFKGKFTSDLSEIIEGDITTIVRALTGTDISMSTVKAPSKKGLRANSEGQTENKPSWLSRVDRSNLTIVDCFSKAEFKRSLEMLAVFIALRASAELEYSWTKRLINSFTTTSHHFNEIYFNRTRFYNVTKRQDEHDQVFLDTIQSRGFVPCPLVFSPYSPMAYQIVNFHHRNTSLERPSTRLKHAGLPTTTLRAEKVCTILGIKKLIRQLRTQCVTCRKELILAKFQPPGKVKDEMISPPSNHHSGILIDLLPSVKISAFLGEKLGLRNSKQVTIHIILAVCLTTRYISFALVTDRSQQALIKGLNNIFIKSARIPKNIYCDRESGITPLARNGKYRIYKNGIYISSDVIIRYCPALGSNHQFHGGIERRIQSVKSAIGNLKMEHMDAISLDQFLNKLTMEINCLPLFSRVKMIHQTPMADIPCLKILSPMQLCFPGFTRGFIGNPSWTEIESKQQELIKQIDHTVWDVLTLMARSTSKDDKKDDPPSIGQLVYFKKTENKLVTECKLGYGIVQRLAPPGLDGVHRSVYIRAMMGGDGINETGDIIGTNSQYVFHRSIGDVIAVNDDDIEEQEVNHQLSLEDIKEGLKEDTTEEVKEITKHDKDKGLRRSTRLLQKAGMKAAFLTMMLSNGITNNQAQTMPNGIARQAFKGSQAGGQWAKQLLQEMIREETKRTADKLKNKIREGLNLNSSAKAFPNWWLIFGACLLIATLSIKNQRLKSNPKNKMKKHRNVRTQYTGFLVIIGIVILANLPLTTSSLLGITYQHIGAKMANQPNRWASSTTINPPVTIIDSTTTKPQVTTNTTVADPQVTINDIGVTRPQTATRNLLNLLLNSMTTDPMQAKLYKKKLLCLLKLHENHHILRILKSDKESVCENGNTKKLTKGELPKITREEQFISNIWRWLKLRPNWAIGLLLYGVVTTATLMTVIIIICSKALMKESKGAEYNVEIEKSKEDDSETELLSKISWPGTDTVISSSDGAPVQPIYDVPRSRPWEQMELDTFTRLNLSQNYEGESKEQGAEIKFDHDHLLHKENRARIHHSNKEDMYLDMTSIIIRENDEGAHQPEIHHSVMQNIEREERLSLIHI